MKPMTRIMAIIMITAIIYPIPSDSDSVYEKDIKDSLTNDGTFVNEDMLVVILIDMQQYFIRGLKKENKERIIANQIFIIKWCAQENIPIVVLEE